MTLSLLLLTLLGLFSCSTDTPTPLEQMKHDLENLSGTYEDLTPYPYGNAFGRRSFTFDKGKWSLTFTLGLDPKLEHQIFHFRTLGTYRIGEPSAIVAHAFHAAFWEDKKFVTLQTDNPELIEAFGFSACDLTPFVEKDISVSGCALWQAVSACPIDYDIVSLDAKGLLYFGERPADNNMCTPENRPTSLTPAVTKIK